MRFFVDELGLFGIFVQMMQFFKRFLLFSAFFLVISSSAILAAPSAEKSESRAFASIIRFLVAKTSPVSLLSLNSSELDQKLNQKLSQKLNQKLKKIVKAVKSSAVKVVFALKAKPPIRLKKTHSRKISHSSISRLSNITIKPGGVAGDDLLHAGSGDSGQHLFKTLSFSELAPKELCRLLFLSWHYSGAIKVGSRLRVFYSGRLTTRYGKKTSDDSDRRGCTRLFGGSIYARRGFSYSQGFSYSKSSKNMSHGLAEVKVRCRLYEHVRVSLLRMPNATNSTALCRLMMGQGASMPDMSNSGDDFKFSNFYIFSAIVNNSMHLV